VCGNEANDSVIWVCVPDKNANRELTFGRVFAFDAASFAPQMHDGDRQ
jgi:hypothetical protein